MRLPVVLFLCLVATASTSWNATLSAADRPNIVFLLADDLGWTGLQCFGSDLYETPNLDALAAKGLKFTNAYAACTVCSPTRASVMTGMYPARLHLTDFIAGQNRPFAKLRIPDWTKRLKSEHVTIAEVLRGSGYATAHIGKWHLEAKTGPAVGTKPTDQGFEVSRSRPSGTKGYYLSDANRSEGGTNFLTDKLTDYACEFIRDAQDKPFFLYFAYNVPHTPIQGREDLVEYFQNKVDESAVHKNPVYAAMVASLDESVGRVVQQLESSGVADNTVIVFTSDNGGLTQRFGVHDGFTENLPLRRGKGSAYEGGVRVPAIVYWPSVTPVGGVCDEPIMTIDYFSTLAELAGAESGIKTDGESLVGLLKDPAGKMDRDLFWHYPHYHAGGDSPYSAIRHGDFRLIEFHEDNSVQLYNLANDPGEANDLANSMTSVARKLTTRLHQWRDSVGAQMPMSNPDYDPARAKQVVSNRKAKR
tara:strand:+ start:782727 stop:784151 length:1425 start_codon:yes stop_codon:yes gene_type:complete